MPKDLYEQVKDNVPSHIGVIIDGAYSFKKAKRVEITIDEKILKDSLIRSLSRQADKLYKSNDPDRMDRMNNRAHKLEKERDDWRNKYHKLMNVGYAKYGIGWYKES